MMLQIIFEERIYTQDDKDPVDITPGLEGGANRGGSEPYPPSDDYRCRPVMGDSGLFDCNGDGVPDYWDTGDRVPNGTCSVGDKDPICDDPNTIPEGV